MQPGKLKEIKDVFMDCLSKTTGHGLPQMVRPGNLFLKLLWKIFVLIGIAGAVFMIYYAIDEFLQFSKINSQYNFCFKQTFRFGINQTCVAKYNLNDFMWTNTTK